MGVIRAIRRGARSAVLSIGAAAVLSDLKLGDSVAVNGVCLTASGLDDTGFAADVMHETLDRSSLGDLTVGSRVNLERAMAAGGRFGGHIVSGHIDGTGTVEALRREDNAVWVRIRAPGTPLRYIVHKGSVAIDGVSLTVASVDQAGFSVSVIPHTGAETTLLSRREGDAVNLECDVIGKYVEKLLAPPGGLTREFLLQHGF